MNAAGSALVDTSVVVAYLRGDQVLRPRFTAFPTIYVPWVVVGELYRGAHRALQPQHAAMQVRKFLDNAVLLPADGDTAERYGEIKAELAQIGRPIPDNDLWVAASARQHGLPLDCVRGAHGAIEPQPCVNPCRLGIQWKHQRRNGDRFFVFSRQFIVSLFQRLYQDLAQRQRRRQ